TNIATLYQNTSAIDNSNTIGTACQGATLVMVPTPGQAVTFPGNAMSFKCSPGATGGYVVGDHGFIGQWNGTSLITQTSPTTKDLLAIDCCGNLFVAVGRDGTILYNIGSGWVTVTVPAGSLVDHPDFTSVTIGPDCNSVYIGSNHGEVLYTPDIVGIAFRVISGVGSDACSPSSFGGRTINTIKITKDGKWLLVGGDGGLLSISSFPQNLPSCTSGIDQFNPVNISSGPSPIGSINAIAQ